MGQHGLIEAGNVDPFNRKVLKNPDGSVSTTSSMSFGEDGKEILIPTVIDGKRLTNEQAIDYYHKTGQHLGKFDSPAAADAYATDLHNRQERQMFGTNKMPDFIDRPLTKDEAVAFTDVPLGSPESADPSGSYLHDVGKVALGEAKGAASLLDPRTYAGMGKMAWRGVKDIAAAPKEAIASLADAPAAVLSHFREAGPETLGKDVGNVLGGAVLGKFVSAPQSGAVDLLDAADQARPALRAGAGYALKGAGEAARTGGDVMPGALRPAIMDRIGNAMTRGGNALLKPRPTGPPIFRHDFGPGFDPQPPEPPPYFRHDLGPGAEAAAAGVDRYAPNTGAPAVDPAAARMKALLEKFGPAASDKIDHGMGMDQNPALRNSAPIPEVGTSHIPYGHADVSPKPPAMRLAGKAPSVEDAIMQALQEMMTNRH